MNPNNLIATKITDSSFVTLNDIINYTVVLQNSGTVPNTGIILTDLVPQGANFVNGSIIVNGGALPSDNPALGVNLPNMPINSVTTVTFQAQVVNPIPGGIMENIGQIDYQYLIAASLTSASIDTNTVTTIQNTAQFMLTKVAPTTSSLGQIITFTITARNIGNVTPTNLRFIDTIPVGTVFVPGSVNINNTTLPAQNPSPPLGLGPVNGVGPNATRTIRFSVQVVSVPPGNTIKNVMDATYDFVVDPVTIRNASGRNSSNITTTTLAFANLGGIIKFVDKAFAGCGDILTYTIAVPNSGPTTATNVIITDTLSNGLTYVPGSLFVDSVPRVDPLTSINLGTIGPGAISTVTFKAQIIC